MGHSEVRRWEGAMRCMSELLQLVLAVALLGSLYALLLLGGAQMGGRGRLSPATTAGVSKACSGELSRSGRIISNHRLEQGQVTE